MASPMDIDHFSPESAARPQRSGLASSAHQQSGSDELRQQLLPREQRPIRRFSNQDDERHHFSLGHSAHFSSSAASSQQPQSNYGQQQSYHPQSPVEFRHRSSQEDGREADRRHYDHAQLQAPLVLGAKDEQEPSGEYGQPSSSHAPGPSQPSNRRRQRRPEHPLTLSSSSSSSRLGASALQHRGSHRQGPLSPSSASAAPTPNDYLSPNSDRDAAFYTSSVTSPSTTTSPSSPQRPYHHHPYYQHAQQPRRFEHDSRQIPAQGSAVPPPTHAHSRFFPAAPSSASHRQQPHFQHAHAPSASSPSAMATSPFTGRQQPRSAMPNDHQSPPDPVTKDGSSTESPDEIDEMEQDLADVRGHSTSASSSKHRLSDAQINGSVGPIRGNASGIGASAAVAAAAKRKSKILNSDRKRICEYHRDNPGHRQDDIAALFGIERSTVSRILKDQDRWLAIEDSSDAAKIAKHRTGRFPTLEARLSEWADTLMEREEAVSDGDLKAQALKFAAELGLEGSFRASLGWCEKFREKKGLRKAFGGPAYPPPPASTASAVVGAMGGAVPSATDSQAEFRMQSKEEPNADDASADKRGEALHTSHDSQKPRTSIETGIPASLDKSGSPPSTETSSNSSHFPSMFSGSLSFSNLDAAGEGNVSGSGISRTDTGSGATGLTTTASSSSGSIAIATATQQGQPRKKPSGMSPPSIQSASPVVPSSAGSAAAFGGLGANGGRSAHAHSWSRNEPHGPMSAGSGGSVSTPHSNPNSTGPSPMAGSVPSPPLPLSRTAYTGPPHGVNFPPPPVVPSHGGATVGLGLGIGAGSGNPSQGGGSAFVPAGSFPSSRQHGVPAQTLPAPASSSFPHAPVSSSPARHQSNRSQQHAIYANHYGGYGLPPPATANLPYSSHHPGSHPHQLPPLSSTSASHLRGSGGYNPQQHDQQLQHSLSGLQRHLPRPHTSHHPHSHPHRSHSFQNEPRQSGSASGTPSGRQHPFAYSSYRDPGSSYYNSSRRGPHDQSPSPPPMLPLPHRYRHNSDAARLGAGSGADGGPVHLGLVRRRDEEVEEEDVVNDEDEVEMYHSSSTRRQYSLDGRMSHLPNGNEQGPDGVMFGDQDQEGMDGRRGLGRDGHLNEDQSMIDGGAVNGHPDNGASGLRGQDSSQNFRRRDYDAQSTRQDQEMTNSEPDGGVDTMHSGSSPPHPRPFSSYPRIANGHGDAHMRGDLDEQRPEYGGRPESISSPQGYYHRSGRGGQHQFSVHGSSPRSIDAGEGGSQTGGMARARAQNGDVAMFSPLPQSLAEPSTPPPPTTAILGAINGLPGHQLNGVNGHAHGVGTNGVNGVSGGAAADNVPASGVETAFGQVMLANEGGDVSIQQARDALDLVLRFLQDQSEAFCPRTHFVTIGNLQGTLAAAAYARAQIRLQQEREAEERQLRPGTASTSTSTSVSSSIPAATADAPDVSDELAVQTVTVAGEPMEESEQVVEMSEARAADGPVQAAEDDAGQRAETGTETTSETAFEKVEAAQEDSERKENGGG